MIKLINYSAFKNVNNFGICHSNEVSRVHAHLSEKDMQLIYLKKVHLQEIYLIQII